MEYDEIPSQIGAGQLPMTEAEMIAALEATGHTVTPPDPLAADRELIMGFLHLFENPSAGFHDDEIPAAMDYLRQNKGRL